MLSDIEKIVREAGVIVCEGFDSAKEVNFKGEIDLVTEYDVRTEKFLLENLPSVLKGYTFVGEESSKGNETADKCVYIDPIDGTTNFVHGFPFVGVSVGVYEYGKPVMGVVFNPIMDEMFTAEEGKGAFLNGNPLKVSSTDEMLMSLLATGFPYASVQDNPDMLMNILNKVLCFSRGIRRPGSASLDLCYVAKGVFDGYYEFNLKPWDVAGGICIVKEAGGMVTDEEGNDHNIIGDSVVATNGILHEQLIKLLRECKCNK